MGQSFEDLEIWKRGRQLAVDVYQSVGKVTDFALRDQMQRSAVSIPSNIAEGSERSSNDFTRMLRIALASAAELRTQAYIAAKVELIDNAAMKHIVDSMKPNNSQK